MHDRDTRRERHRLDLVMRDVDRRLADALVQLLDLGAHFDAQLGVEVGKRFVEQEQFRIANQRAPHGDALALSAGQLAGLAIQQRLDLQKPGDALDRRFAVHLGHAPTLHTESDVLAGGHGRVKRVGLEHHGDVAVLWRDRIDDPAVDADFALADDFEPGDHGEQRRFSATGRPDERDKLARARFEVDAFEHFDWAKALVQSRDRQRGHGASLI